MTGKTVHHVCHRFYRARGKLVKHSVCFNSGVNTIKIQPISILKADDWLFASALINKCAKVSRGQAPLNAHAENASFKLYMADTGILCAGYGISPEVFQRESTAWQGIKGALTENYVSSALVSNGYTPYYWESEGKAEIDFLIQTQNGAIIPVENVFMYFCN